MRTVDAGVYRGTAAVLDDLRCNNRQGDATIDKQRKISCVLLIYTVQEIL